MGLEHESSGKKTAMNVLKTSLELTEGLAKACKCDPLEGTAGLLLKALERFEVAEDVQEDLPLIASRVRNMAALFQRYMAEQRNEEVLKLMESLTRAMEVVHDFIQEKMNRTAVRRVWHAQDDAKDVVRILRILGDTANDFLMESNRNLDTKVNQVLQELKMLDLPYTAEALPENILDKTGCTTGTRVHVLADLMDWITATTADAPPVCWLNGHAGSGKTTIMLTMCDILRRSGLLGGSFFCSREDKQRQLMTNIIPTLTHQLATKIPDFHSALTVALEGHKGIRLSGPQEQFDVLLAGPARATFAKARTVPMTFSEAGPAPGTIREAMRPRVILIDALDECDSTGDVTRQFLHVIFKNAQGLGIRFLIASRPEPRFFDTFQGGKAEWSTSLHLQDVPVETAKEDVLTFLNSELSRFSEENTRLTLPTEDQLQQLATQSAGFFIYASTAWKFASATDCLDPRIRLQEVLESQTFPTQNNVEQLYAFVLQQLRDRMTDTEWTIIIRCLQAVICLAVPLAVNELANLLGKEEREVRNILIVLQSVVRLPLPELDEPVVIHHASFADYLLGSRSQSMPWHVNTEQAHEELHRQCWRVMGQFLRFNVSNSSSSYLANNKQPTKPHLPGELVYACRYWINHISYFRPSPSCISHVLASFSLLFLYWLEVLSVTNHANEAQATLSTLWLRLRKLSGKVRDRETTGKNGSGDKESALGITQPQADGVDDDGEPAMELEQFAYEARRFVGAYVMPITISAPHIYVSAFASLDGDSRLKKALGHHFRWMPNVITQQAQSIGSVTMRGHSGEVSFVAFSPDGRRIASGSYDHTIRMWNADTGAQSVHPLEGHSDMVNCIAFSPNGKRIASGSNDRTIRMWDADTGAQLGQPLEGHSDWITSVAFSPDGKRIASGSWDRTIRMWDTETGAQVGQPLEGHSGEISSVAFSPDGKHIVSGSDDRTIRMWDTETDTQLGQPLEGHSGEVSFVAFSPEGNRIASGSHDRTIRIWNSNTGAQVGQPLQGHSHWITSIAFSPDGKRIASGSHDCTIRIWNADKGTQLSQPLEGYPGSIKSVAFSPDGKCIASGSSDSTIRMWDADTVTDAGQTLEGCSGTIASPMFSPHAKPIVSGADEHTIRKWDAEMGVQDGQRLKGHSGGIYSVTFSPDGKCIASGADDGTIRMWDADTGAQVGQPLEGHSEPIASVAFSPDGKRIASGSLNGTIRMWDSDTGAQVGQTLGGHSNQIRSVTFSPDGKRIVSGSSGDKVYIWDAESGVQIGQPLEGHSGSVFSAVFSPDGKRVVSGSIDCTVRVWDANTGAQVGQPLKGHSLRINSVIFSPNGKRIASGSDDSTVRMWNADTGLQVGQLMQGHSGPIQSVAFSFDGKHIASGSQGGVIQMWDAETCVQVGQPLEGNSDEITCVTFSPDGKRIASASTNGTIRISIYELAFGYTDGLPHVEYSDTSNSDVFPTTSVHAHPQSTSSVSCMPMPTSLDSSPFYTFGFPRRPQFRLDRDGWIRDRDDKLIFWMPSEYRPGLWWPGLSLLIGAHPVRIDLGRCPLGEGWTRCFTP